MNKKSAKSKLSLSFIGILLAALSLCFLAFTSANAVSDEPEPEIPDVPQGNIMLEVQRSDLGTIQYQINGTLYPLTESKVLTAEDMKDLKEIYLLIKPNQDAIIDKESTIIHNGDNFVSLKDQDYIDLEAGKYKLTYNPNAKKGQYAKLAILETRLVTVSLTDASSKMLANNFTLMLGHGDKNDVKVTDIGTMNNIRIDKGTTDKLIMSFAIRSETYFIPYITVNGQKYETVDTGMHDEEEHVIICSTLEGDAAKPDTFQVDLSIYARPECESRSESMKIVQEATSYDYMIDGVVVNKGDYKLSGSDTPTDPQVENAVATYDLELTKDSIPETDITGGMDIHLLLKPSTYSVQDYKVVRNHDGVVEELDTTCEVVRNRETGEVEGVDVGFNSDKFSDFSVVPVNSQPVVPEDTQVTAQTGDNIPYGIALVVLAVSAFAVYRTARRPKGAHVK